MTARSMAVPEWRIRAYGPPLTSHDPRCVLDPLHLRETPCGWWYGTPWPTWIQPQLEAVP